MVRTEKLSNSHESEKKFQFCLQSILFEVKNESSLKQLLVPKNIVNFYGTWKYKTSVGRSIFLFNLLQTFFNDTPSLWQYRLWSFKLSDT